MKKPAGPALSCAIGALALGACLAPGRLLTASSQTAERIREVTQTERTFARSMAERDHLAFTGFLAEETIFFTGDRVLRGKAEVAAAWKGYFEGQTAPFSWEPAIVEVLPSGTLAQSSGPVRDRSRKTIATFTSVWRREAPRKWRIVFDKGNPVCAPPGQ